MFSEWYSKFKTVTFSSIVIPLPKIFVDYLDSDEFSTLSEGFPEFVVEDEDDQKDFQNLWSTKKLDIKVDPKLYQTSYEDDSDSSDDEDIIEEDNTEETEEQKEKKRKRKIKEDDFQDLIKTINESIKKLGGQVLAKLNWSTPKDAQWMNLNNSLKCSNAAEILLLLKSSDFINHDLAQLKIDPNLDDQALTPYTLVLRKWHNLYASMEFRCTVKNNELIAISQRDTSTFYSFLKGKKAKIQETIQNFFTKKIQNQFSQNDYTFDIYITQEYEPWLIDFNPIHPSTESLLFLWDELFPELIQDDDEEVEENNNEKEKDEDDNNNNTKPPKESIKVIESLEFRIVEAKEGIKPNLSMTSRLPLDLLNYNNNAYGAENENINQIFDKFQESTDLNKK
ncbi:cell division cycle protein [Tieghemostelium lacteum]|uniref:Cell division cycle protein n=1 Tax=Tieghemostelium lacteum TaxID=361077 RepID=A0A151ZDQ4_TIELA|nr:cell division cycle protein [Tieghemostelium lacteum]|eukprot:KYQ92092.1 cell division cycle protein [Tieghemostelium lacteum]